MCVLLSLCSGLFIVVSPLLLNDMDILISRSPPLACNIDISMHCIGNVLALLQSSPPHTCQL